MNFYKLFFLLIGIIFIALQTTILSTTILFNQKEIKINKPIITVNNNEFIPIFEFKKILNLKIKQSHKFNGYYIKFNSNSLLISLNTNEVWLNNTRHFLIDKTINKHGTLYAPLSDIANLLGLTFSKNNTTYTITKNKSPFITTNPFVAFQKKHIDTVRYRFKKNILNPTLSYKNKNISLKKCIIYKQKTVYIQSNNLLAKLGYTFTIKNNIVTLIYNEFTYKIPLNSRIWKGHYNNQSWNFLAEKPIIKTAENKLLIPFSSFFAFLDYSLHFNNISKTIEILDNIHFITLNTKKNKEKISIGSRHSLEYINTKYNKNTDIFSVQFPYSISYLKTKKTFFNKNPFIYIKCTQINFTHEQLHGLNSPYGQRQTLLEIKLSHNQTFLPQKNSHGISLSLKKKINTVSIKSTKDFHKVTLKGKQIETPTIYKENKMIILDFSQTINELPNIKKINKNNLRSFRSSQLSYSPLITRFVIDFNNKIPSFSTEKNTDSIVISIKKEKQKTSPKPKTNSNLYNKVIVLDPGHGGKDPGAVTKKNKYEKFYTLDIAKRIQKLLENEGAFVILTRSSDTTKSLQKRIKIANKQKADLFVSVHLNSFSSSSVNGSKTFYYKYKDKKLAQHISKQLSHDLTLKNNGISRKRFFVLRHTSMPATLIEPLFLTSPKDRKKLNSIDFRNKLSLSIFQGLKNYYADS